MAKASFARKRIRAESKSAVAVTAAIYFKVNNFFTVLPVQPQKRCENKHLKLVFPQSAGVNLLFNGNYSFFGDDNIDRKVKSAARDTVGHKLGVANPHLQCVF